MSGFGSIDKTGDGLCLDEFVEYLKVTYGVNISKDLARGVFNDIDSRRSDDDRIVWSEWQEFLKAKPFSDVQREDLIKLFHDADTDKNLELTSSELYSKLSEKGYTEDDIRILISDCDTNKDSKINKNEWEKMVDGFMNQKK